VTTTNQWVRVWGLMGAADDWGRKAEISGLAEYIKSQKVNEALGAADEAAIKRSKHKTAKEQEIYLLLCHFRPATRPLNLAI